MLQKTFPQTANLDKSRHPQLLNQIIKMWIGIDWIDLRLFSYLLILVICEITLKLFENHLKSFLSLGHFNFWSRYLNLPRWFSEITFLIDLNFSLMVKIKFFRSTGLTKYPQKATKEIWLVKQRYLGISNWFQVGFIFETKF